MDFISNQYAIYIYNSSSPYPLFDHVSRCTVGHAFSDQPPKTIISFSEYVSNIIKFIQVALSLMLDWIKIISQEIKNLGRKTKVWSPCMFDFTSNKTE